MVVMALLRLLSFEESGGEPRGASFKGRQAREWLEAMTSPEARSDAAVQRPSRRRNKSRYFGGDDAKHSTD